MLASWCKAITKHRGNEIAAFAIILGWFPSGMVRGKGFEVDIAGNNSRDCGGIAFRNQN